MMKRRSGLCLLLASLLVLTGGCAFSLQNTAGIGGVDGPSYRITAVFARLARLPVGGTVRVGQEQVGQVSSIETEDFRAIVHMRIKQGARLPAGTRARLELTSALGEQQVVLKLPTNRHTGAELSDGAVIPPRHTSAGPDVEPTLAAIGALVNGAGIAQARTIINEVSTALDGRAQEIHDLLGQLDTALGTLSEHSESVTSLIDSLHSLSGTLNNQRSTLEAAATRIKPAIDVLLSQRDEFLTLLGKVTSLARAADGLLKRTGDALTSTVHKLRPVLRNLRGIDGRLGSVLRKMRQFDELLQQAVPGDYLLLDGTLDVPLTVAELLTPDLSEPQRSAGGIRELLDGGT